LEESSQKIESKEIGKEGQIWPLFLFYRRFLAIAPRTTTTRPIPPSIINIFVESSNGSNSPVGRGEVVGYVGDVTAPADSNRWRL
jgi:hypothetical protein